MPIGGALVFDFVNWGIWDVFLLYPMNTQIKGLKSDINTIYYWWSVVDEVIKLT